MELILLKAKNECFMFDILFATLNVISQSYFILRSSELSSIFVRQTTVGRRRKAAVFIVDLGVLVTCSHLPRLDTDWKVAVFQPQTLRTEDWSWLAEVPPEPVGEVGGGAGLQVCLRLAGLGGRLAAAEHDDHGRQEDERGQGGDHDGGHDVPVQGGGLGLGLYHRQLPGVVQHQTDSPPGLSLLHLLQVDQ